MSGEEKSPRPFGKKESSVDSGCIFGVENLKAVIICFFMFNGFVLVVLESLTFFLWVLRSFVSACLPIFCGLCIGLVAKIESLRSLVTRGKAFIG